jgi:hypothetical protein
MVGIGYFLVWCLSVLGEERLPPRIPDDHHPWRFVLPHKCPAEVVPGKRVDLVIEYRVPANTKLVLKGALVVYCTCYGYSGASAEELAKLPPEDHTVSVLVSIKDLLRHAMLRDYDPVCRVQLSPVGGTKKPAAK